jgi:hypothetical protein
MTEWARSGAANSVMPLGPQLQSCSRVRVRRRRAGLGAANVLSLVDRRVDGRRSQASITITISRSMRTTPPRAIEPQPRARPGSDRSPTRNRSIVPFARIGHSRPDAGRPGDWRARHWQDAPDRRYCAAGRAERHRRSPRWRVGGAGHAAVPALPRGTRSVPATRTTKPCNACSAQTRSRWSVSSLSSPRECPYRPLRRRISPRSTLDGGC